MLNFYLTLDNLCLNSRKPKPASESGHKEYTALNGFGNSLMSFTE